MHHFTRRVAAAVAVVAVLAPTAACTDDPDPCETPARICDDITVEIPTPTPSPGELSTVPARQAEVTLHCQDSPNLVGTSARFTFATLLVQNTGSSPASYDVTVATDGQTKTLSTVVWPQAHTETVDYLVGTSTTCAIGRIDREEFDA